MGIEEAHRRLAAGWHVEPPLLELIEGDYDSAQRKRFIRAAQNEGALLNASCPKRSALVDFNSESSYQVVAIPIR